MNLASLPDIQAEQCSILGLPEAPPPTGSPSQPDSIPEPSPNQMSLTVIQEALAPSPAPARQLSLLDYPPVWHPEPVTAPLRRRRRRRRVPPTALSPGQMPLF